MKVRYTKECLRDDASGIKVWSVGDINDRPDSYLLLPYGNVEPADEEAEAEWQKYLERAAKRNPKQRELHAQLRASDKASNKKLVEKMRAEESKAEKEDL